MAPHLPTPSSSLRLSLLDGGSFIADTSKLHAGVGNEKFRMYNWAFCISHGEEHVLWDLGLSGDPSLYTPWVNKHMLAHISPSAPRRSITEQLLSRGISPLDIKTIIFSHAHWDHSHPPSPTFPLSTSLFGPGTLSSCSPGHLSSPASQWDGRFFDPEFATERCAELPGPWVPFGPFDKAMDFFGDATFWVVQAPGHMVGNLCAVCRVGGEWVVLGSDCCHSRGILNGTHEIAQFSVPHQEGVTSLHADLDAARETITKIRVLEREFGAHVALAHDAEWMREGTDEVLMGLLDGEMGVAARERIPRGEVA